jgi:hypothetical protein
MILATTILAAATGGAFAQSGGGMNQPNDKPQTGVDSTHSGSMTKNKGTTGSGSGINNPARDSAKKNVSPGTQNPANGAAEEK